MLATVTPERAAQAAEPIPPREQVAIPVGQDVVLIGHDAGAGTLNPGQELRITLKWQAPDECCADEPWTGAKMALRGDGWEVVQPVRVFGGYSLDWHAFVVPAGASGEAVLAVGSETLEPVTLATYVLEHTDRRSRRRRMMPVGRSSPLARPKSRRRQRVCRRTRSRPDAGLKAAATADACTGCSPICSAPRGS